MIPCSRNTCFSVSIVTLVCSKLILYPIPGNVTKLIDTRFKIRNANLTSSLSVKDNTCMGLFEGGGRGGGGGVLVTLGMHSNQQMAVIHYIELWNFNITSPWYKK